MKHRFLAIALGAALVVGLVTATDADAHGRTARATLATADGRSIGRRETFDAHAAAPQRGGELEEALPRLEVGEDDGRFGGPRPSSRLSGSRREGGHLGAAMVGLRPARPIRRFPHGSRGDAQRATPHGWNSAPRPRLYSAMPAFGAPSTS